MRLAVRDVPILLRADDDLAGVVLELAPFGLSSGPFRRAFVLHIRQRGPGVLPRHFGGFSLPPGLPLCFLVSKGGFHCDSDDLQQGVLPDMVVFPGGGTEPRLAFFPGSNLAVFALIIAEGFFLSRHRDCL